MVNAVSVVALACASVVAGLNIILTNDDSWAAANIRATFTALQKDGHNVLMVAPATQQSGHGGTFVLPTTNIVPPGGEFNSIPVGAPFAGHDVSNPLLTYFNGTPASSLIWGLDQVAPQHFGGPANQTVDLIVSGPNEGGNNGPFLYTLSGTIGAAYAGIERGIPAVAFSAGNNTHRSFTTNTGKPDDPANIAAQLTANFVAALAKGVNTKKQRLLPLGVGINVNFPTFGPGNNCTNPPFILTRMTGGATVDSLSVGSTGFPQFGSIVTPGVNVCFNGICSLPGEAVVSAKCETAFSVFSVDYDAPTGVALPVQHQLSNIVGRSKIH